MSKAFTPPAFGKFGSDTKSLFDNKFETKHQLKSIRKSAGGLSLESAATLEADKVKAGNILRGYLKGNYTQPRFAFDFNVNTDPKESSTAAVKLTKLTPGLIVNLTHNTAHKWSKEATAPATILETTYTKDAVVATAEYKTDQRKHQVKATASVGFDGVSVGGLLSVHANATGDEPNLLDYNLGLEYAQPQYVASLFTEQKLDWAVLNLFYKHRPNHSVGAQVRFQVAGKHEHELTLGSELKLDSTTTIKSKFQVPKKELSLAVEHRLANPQVAVQLAANFKPLTFANSPVKAENFGFGLTFGDY